MITPIILVDRQDNAIGTMEKLKAHQQGLLHRAFSVFVYRRCPSSQETEVLLQKRQINKYHSGGLWTNTCCSHPLPNEDIITAAKRRLKEEMGISAHDVGCFKKKGVFYYFAQINSDLTEHEIDHVLSVEIKSPTLSIQYNPQEVSEICWLAVSTLQDQLRQHPEQYTVWLKKALDCIR